MKPEAKAVPVGLRELRRLKFAVRRTLISQVRIQLDAKGKGHKQRSTHQPHKSAHPSVPRACTKTRYTQFDRHRTLEWIGGPDGQLVGSEEIKIRTVPATCSPYF